MERRRAAAAAIGVWALVTGCYATTPHRPEVQGFAARPACMAAIDDVFTRAAFVPRQTPAGYTAFFAPRMGVSQTRSQWADIGIGVVVSSSPAGEGGSCRVVLEALAMNDGTCSADESNLGCALPDPRVGPTVMACPVSLITTCPMTSAPSPTNDALVDDLARRLREALGPNASVSGLTAT